MIRPRTLAYHARGDRGIVGSREGGIKVSDARAREPIHTRDSRITAERARRARPPCTWRGRANNITFSNVYYI